MPDETFSVPEISRLSFTDDCETPVLLNGEPFDLALEIWEIQFDKEWAEKMFFPVGLEDDAEQSLVLERLKKMAGWTPILVGPGLDLSGSVVSAWVEERDGLVLWSRFAYGPDGGGQPVDLAPAAFIKDNYQRFIEETEDAAVVNRLFSRLAARPPRPIGLAGELSRHGPQIGFKLLRRLVYNSARGRCLLNRAKRGLPRVILTLLAIFVAGGLAAGLPFYFDLPLRFKVPLGIFGGLLLAFPLLMIALSPGYRDPWPLVFLTVGGFQVGWARELVPWEAVMAYAPEPVGAGPARPMEAVLTVEDDGRLDFKLKYQDNPAAKGFRPDPDLSALNAALAGLIRKRLKKSPNG